METKRFNFHQLKSNLLALFAGTLLPFAFAPYEYSFLAVISSLLFFFTLQKKFPKAAFLTGFFYGVGLFGVGASWIYISIHTYGNTNILLGLTITLLFVMTLALFPALLGYLLQKYSSDSTPSSSLTRALIIFPAIGAILEWCRSYVFTGFPWLLLGYSQINSPLAGYAPVLGIYGV
jgi:apolipoprotein N-acyltransferase